MSLLSIVSWLIASHFLISLTDCFMTYLFLQHRVDHSIPQSDSTFHPQVVLIRVFVPIVDLELLPDAPEGTLVLLRVAVLAQMCVNTTRPLNLIKLSFKLCKPQAELY